MRAIEHILDRSNVLLWPLNHHTSPLGNELISVVMVIGANASLCWIWGWLPFEIRLREGWYHPGLVNRLLFQSLLTILWCFRLWYSLCCHQHFYLTHGHWVFHVDSCPEETLHIPRQFRRLVLLLGILQRTVICVVWGAEGLQIYLVRFNPCF